VRITFDRRAAATHDTRSLEPQNWCDVKLEYVILELKFDDRFPLWMRELVRCCNLYRTTMGKYVHCTQQIPRPDRPYAYVTA
jgi:hypothetical protein